MGTGSLSFDDRLTSSATTLTSTTATYQHAMFTIAAIVTGKPDVFWTTGRASIGFDSNPPAGLPKTADTFQLLADDGDRRAFGDLTLSAPSTAISNGNFTRQNFVQMLGRLTS